MLNDAILYNNIGTAYDSTRRADPYIAKKLIELLIPKTGENFLDIGCGTGNYTIALANRGINIYGVEPSEAMLEIARQKSGAVSWLNGVAENIPARDAFFDGAIATLTIHHWADLKKGFTELYRVLNKNGRLLIFTALPAQMEKYWLNHYFPQMLSASIKQMPTINNIEKAAALVGFKIITTEKYFIKDDLKDLFLYAGKNNPGMYLNSKIRNGISSFSALANTDEVNNGLAKLSVDINTGEFEKIKTQLGDDEGDYLFILLEKEHK